MMSCLKFLHRALKYSNRFNTIVINQHDHKLCFNNNILHSIDQLFLTFWTRLYTFNLRELTATQELFVLIDWIFAIDLLTLYASILQRSCSPSRNVSIFSKSETIANSWGNHNLTVFRLKIWQINYSFRNYNSCN